MVVFVYEYCTALGVGREPTDPLHSLYREGRAMCDALVADFGQVDEVLTLDVPASEEPEAFRELARRADWSLVVAPESGGALVERCRWVEQVGGRLLGPSSAAVELTSDKFKLSQVWAVAGVSTPRTWRCPEAPNYPAVLKPIDGAGSSATFLVPDADGLASRLSAAADEGYSPDGLLLQEYVPGLAASVAFLVGPASAVPLLPGRQLLSSDGRFRYEGGEIPLTGELAARAVALGRQAIECVGGLFGYVGVDVVLGDADYAIEINPRMTTSYVGLRELSAMNLAGAMLAVASGAPLGDVLWRPGAVRFAP